MSSSCDHFLEKLNSCQKQAVLVKQKHLRIIAGAGSGKTQVLTCRIAYLKGTSHLLPDQFLIATFTNKAANEMKERLSKLLNESHHSMWIGTFHSVANRMLHQHAQLAGLSSSFQILDSSDQQQIIKRLIRAKGLDEGRFVPKNVQAFINQQKDKGLRAHQVSTAEDNPYERVMQQLYQAYELHCQQAQVVDFSELLLRTYDLLNEQPHILQHYHKQFRHILVDEFQDTSAMQYNWIRLIAGPDTWLTIVGDDDQSIYSWRGARIENMHRFEHDFPNSETLYLEQNYRSPGIVLAAANALIANNQERLGKTLWTAGDIGEPIAVYAAFNDLDEARFIVKRIQEAKKKGIAYKDMALLYRSNAQSRILEETLLQFRIPYQVYGGLRFFERAEVKDGLAYLRLVNYTNDDTAFERIINTPTRGLGEKTIEILRQIARDEGSSLYQASQYALEANLLSARAVNALNAFMKLIHQMQLGISQMSVGEQTEYILQTSGLLSHYQKNSFERTQAKFENLNELIYAARQFVPESNEDNALANFLNRMTLEAGDYNADNEVEKGVQLMTLHAAKGLEFPLVFLTGLEEGLFPSHMSLSEPGRLEEERRLCYVGMTRAMQQLYITYAEIRRHYGNETHRTASRFLKEIPEKHLSYIRPTARVSFSSQFSGRSALADFPDSTKTEKALSATGFQIHQRVRHPSFGLGTILNYEGEGTYTRIQVKFDGHGAKWLVLNFAKLEVAS